MDTIHRAMNYIRNRGAEGANDDARPDGPPTEPLPPGAKPLGQTVSQSAEPRMEPHLVDVTRREVQDEGHAKRSLSMRDVYGHMAVPAGETIDGLTPAQPHNPARSTPPEFPDFRVDRKPAQYLDAQKQHFDELKVNFLARFGAQTKQTVLVLGTSKGDGATTVAGNFAASLAKDLDARVLLINGDLRAPIAHDPGRGHVGPGLTSLAHREAQVPLPAEQGNLFVLPRGRGYADPAALFQSKRFDVFMTQMQREFDYIVIDGPALENSPESIALCAKVDGVILVVDAQRTRRKIAAHAKRRIEEVGGKLLGVVLNRRKYYIPRWLYKFV